MNLSQVSRLDRRWIFLALLLVVLIPQFLRKLPPPQISETQEARDLYAAVDALPAGAPLLLSLDFNPGSKPELYPAAKALLRHAFRKKLRIVVMNLWIDGTGMVAQLVQEVAIETYGSPAEAEKRYGSDYAFLGWRPGTFAVIVQLGTGIESTYETDFRGQKTGHLPVLKGISNLTDFPLVITVSAGNPGIEEWLQYGQGKYNIALGGAVTAVSAPAMLTFVRSGQLVGLLGGMKGAAEYEKLIGMPDYAYLGMNALSASHFFIIGLIIFSNVVYFLQRRTRSPG
jgi:hypothetical protein